MTDVVWEDLPGEHTAEQVFEALVGDDDDAFWLDSGDDGVSYIGTGTRWIPDAPVLPALHDELARQRVTDAAGFPIGLVGWLDYRLRAETLDLPAGDERARFLRVTRGVRVAPGGRCTLFARRDGGEDSLARWRGEVLAALLRPLPARPEPVAGAPRWQHTRASYRKLVEACQAAIADGEAYVLNLTTEVRVRGIFDPVSVYRRLRGRTPAHHGGLIRIAGTTLASASPEQFLAVGPDGIVSTSPVKGTAARQADAAADAAAARRLGASVKERAENLMIVDLMRNDLARVSDTADVAVPQLLAVETHPHIHQLVSTVTGRLRPGLGAADVIAATFPAGSMTGAPKRRAVELLSALEQRERGPYAGAFGYLCADGTVDLAMTIRAIVFDGDEAVIGVGGGITALSDPAAELAEVGVKAAPLLWALGAGP